MFIYIFTHLFANSDFSWKNNFLECSTLIYRSKNYKKCIVLDLRGSSSLYRALSNDVTVAILEFQNNGTAAMLVYLDNRPIRLTQCCTQFKSPEDKILIVLDLHYNVAFTFK